MEEAGLMHWLVWFCDGLSSTFSGIEGVSHFWMMDIAFSYDSMFTNGYIDVSLSDLSPLVPTSKHRFFTRFPCRGPLDDFPMSENTTRAQWSYGSRCRMPRRSLCTSPTVRGPDTPRLLGQLEATKIRVPPKSFVIRTATFATSTHAG